MKSALVLATLATVALSDTVSTIKNNTLSTSSTAGTLTFDYWTSNVNDALYLNGNITITNFVATSWTSGNNNGLYAGIFFGGKTDGIYCT